MVEQPAKTIPLQSGSALRLAGRRAVLGLGLLALVTSGTALLLYDADPSAASFSADPDAARRRDALAAVTSWSRGSNPSVIDTASGDPTALLVIDAPAIADIKISAAQQRLARLQPGEGGSRRPVLAALTANSLADKETMFQRETLIVDALLARGADGVLIDCRKAFADAKAAGRQRVDQLAEAIGLLADRARLIDPGFLIVIENASALAADPRVLRAIDGVAQENVLYGQDGPAVANRRTDVVSAVHDISRIKRAGRAVLVTEYLDEDATVARAGALQVLRGMGFVARFAPTAQRGK